MFTEESTIVKDYILLINNKEKILADIPDFKNLREVVRKALEESIQSLHSTDQTNKGDV